MARFKKGHNNSNRLIGLAAQALSILSIFAIGKMDHAHADLGEGNLSHDGDGISSVSGVGGDIAYISIGGTDIDDQWGGGTPKPE